MSEEERQKCIADSNASSTASKIFPSHLLRRLRNHEGSPYLPSMMLLLAGTSMDLG